MINDLPRDLLEEIFSRVPLKSMRTMRLTCKKWNNTLSKSKSLMKMHMAKATTTKEGESIMITIMNYNLHLMSVNVIDPPCIKSKGKLTCLKEQVKIYQVFHCEGLLLCILKDDTNVVVWNPYCGQTRWIELRQSHLPKRWESRDDKFCYALGYENNKSCLNFKILRFIDYYLSQRRENCFYSYEIYDFDSDLWTTLDVTPRWFISYCDIGVSLKGNTYWCAYERNSSNDECRIICFDFTRNRFGPFLPLPYIGREYDYMSLSCVRDEKLAALFQLGERNSNVEIWITTKIEDETVSWSKFLRMEMGVNIRIPFLEQGFYFDEEKKVAMGFDEDSPNKFFIIGENGYSREVKTRLGEKTRNQSFTSFVCSYVPSLVQIKKPARD